MAQPFALERLASKVGLAQKRAQQDYYDARAKEATDLLEKELLELGYIVTESGKLKELLESNDEVVS